MTLIGPAAPSAAASCGSADRRAPATPQRSRPPGSTAAVPGAKQIPARQAGHRSPTGPPGCTAPHPPDGSGPAGSDGSAAAATARDGSDWAGSVRCSRGWSAVVPSQPPSVERSGTSRSVQLMMVVTPASVVYRSTRRKVIPLGGGRGPDRFPSPRPGPPTGRSTGRRSPGGPHGNTATNRDPALDDRPALVEERCRRPSRPRPTTSRPRHRHHPSEVPHHLFPVHPPRPPRTGHLHDQARRPETLAPCDVCSAMRPWQDGRRHLTLYQPLPVEDPVTHGRGEDTSPPIRWGSTWTTASEHRISSNTV